MHRKKYPNCYQVYYIINKTFVYNFYYTPLFEHSVFLIINTTKESKYSIIYSLHEILKYCKYSSNRKINNYGLQKKVTELYYYR